MSPAEARFQLLQGGRGPTARAELLRAIRRQWGEQAVQDVRHRLEGGTVEEVEAWLRRSSYFLDLQELLDLKRTLPVFSLQVAGLLELLTAKDRPGLSLILLRLAASALRPWREAECAVPWLKDIPDSERALEQLRSQGWLLVACPQRGQGLALWRSIRKSKEMLLDRYELHA